MYIADAERELNLEALLSNLVLHFERVEGTERKILEMCAKDGEVS